MALNPLVVALTLAVPFEIRDMLVPAYLDGGTGSLIFQVLVASLVSGGVVFGNVMSRLRRFFTRDEPDVAPANSMPSSENAGPPPSELVADPHMEARMPERKRKAA